LLTRGDSRILAASEMGGSPMRVLMISKACVVGAYQTKLEELARFPDLELTVIVPPYWREGRSRLQLERAHIRGYELVVARMAFNGHFHMHYYPSLGQHMHAVRPDIVHIDEEPYNLATAHAMWLAKRHRAKALFFTWQNLLRSYPFPFGAMERYNYAQADYALAGNAAAVEVLRAKGYRGPVEVIPQFGVDPAIYRPSITETSGVSKPWKPCGDSEQFVIGYAGRLVPEKGVDILLRAVAGLEGCWLAEIVGGGPERAHLEELASDLGIAGRVTFHGWVASAEMPRWLNRFDVLVLPSLTRPNWREQFGRILVEAMACEVPVIGSDSGEIPNVIGEVGLATPEGDVEALRHALRAVRSEPDARARWGEPGRRRVLARYTQARIAARTYEVYRRLSS